MNDLAIFNYNDTAVRTIVIGDEPWFVAGDVARILGYSATAAMTRSLDEDEKGVQTLHTLGGNQEVTIISEAGMFSAILRSTIPQARMFKRWLTHEVLPQLHRTGSYSMEPAQRIDLNAIDPRTLALAILEESDRADRAEQEVERLAPRAAVGDLLLDADGDMSVGDAAKSLSRAGWQIGSQRLFTLLSMIRWIYRGGDGRWCVRQDQINTGRMSVLPQSHYHPKTGDLVLDPPQPRVTPKGLEYLLAHHGPKQATGVIMTSTEQAIA